MCLVLVRAGAVTRRDKPRANSLYTADDGAPAGQSLAHSARDSGDQCAGRGDTGDISSPCKQPRLTGRCRRARDVCATLHHSTVKPVAHIQLAVDPPKGGHIGSLIVPFHKDVGHAAAQHAGLDQTPQDGVLAPFHIHPAQRRSQAGHSKATHKAGQSKATHKARRERGLCLSAMCRCHVLEYNVARCRVA